MEKNKPSPPENASKKKLLDSYIRYSGLALQLVVMIILGVWAGIKLDEIYPSVSPLFKLVFSLGSVSFSIYFLIRKLSRNS